MKRTFIYKEKFSFSYWYPAIVFVALAVLSFVFKYGIALRNLRLFAYPNSLYVLSLCAVLFIVYALYKRNRAKASAANPNPFEIDDTGITFPKRKNECVTVAFADVEELWHKNDEDDGQQVIIYTTGKDRYEFSEDHFANTAEFSEFEKIMDDYCVNITNR
jgi:cbb3-type cytochrome oxidase subunit 3